MSDKIKESFEKNKKVFIWLASGLPFLFSCRRNQLLFNLLADRALAIIASSYLSEDDAMLGAEGSIAGMEQESCNAISTPTKALTTMMNTTSIWTILSMTLCADSHSL